MDVKRHFCHDLAVLLKDKKAKRGFIFTGMNKLCGLGELSLSRLETKIKNMSMKPETGKQTITRA